MATNKNQHFVPRCYLRPFTIDSNNQAINLFNTDRQIFIQNAPVKNQCSRDYFYGKDQKLEAAIQSVESLYASTLREILAHNGILTEKHKYALRIFWLLQHLRTEAASKRSVEMSNDLTTGLDVEHSFRLEISEAVQAAMRVFAANMDAISDLKVCLIRNKSRLPFITSDDPAILTNRWHFNNLRRTRLSFGLQHCGALALLPLSPEVYFIGYDGDVYSIPSKDGWITIRRDSDANALNQHQYLNCRANIFIKNPLDHPRVAVDYNSVLYARPESRHNIHYAIFDKEVGDHKRYAVVDADVARKHEDVLMHFTMVHPKPTAWPSHLEWRHKGVVYTNGTGRGFVRKAFIDNYSPPFIKQPSFIR
ncbi:DUF4238 domain-containing protein [Pseudomonas aeruginosa]|uniref:DUF4238 domain-containing protein n=1 Tax=Pseudomonas aeruginosa TaxID=287 RepID=UPI000935DF76|nr:DUF4238 domain-containing protein [Pseudomonas aeruginosa]MCT5519315.1 DUF4238 domain-containing protein [Pseudomonas aeruginosa]MEE2515670.1 DUF4238 domain-containing protein [Pseudomonas aeruginosa]HEJ1327451.1 DUF4238 domain-containing protein [Pseudomonas aeruginosa]